MRGTYTYVEERMDKKDRQETCNSSGKQVGRLRCIWYMDIGAKRLEQIADVQRTYESDHKRM